MPIVLGNRVKETTTTTGTGTLTLAGAVAGFQSFAAIGNGNQTYYTITDGTDWETGLGTYTSSGTTLSRDQVYESSNSNAAVNWGAGAKEVFSTFPSEASGGTIATADNSSIGTDEVAWQNFQKLINRGVVGGVPYNNGGGVGVISTYSLIYTGSFAYSGGVLALNGDIHFVPQSAPVGQKVSVDGVVSTYSLVYTRSAAYTGGVLAPNGDIHFVPDGANRGQKISASGVVSTYSLVYTTSLAYYGGVLAPNGDIHFVPSSAAVGQKISASGVVSTYSLVYTAGSAQFGGVIAPNGEIIFVPYVGGTVGIGQKISVSGVVSTFSLPGTSIVYQGGVLGPNGHIYLIPAGNPVNRYAVISPNGVISTLSLIYTGNGTYFGGVLAPNGDIHFVPNTAAVGQKISTGSGQFPLAVCCSSYLNKF